MTFAKFGGTAREVCAKATGFNDGYLDAERVKGSAAPVTVRKDSARMAPKFPKSTLRNAY
jgi:hypothetical protein